VTRRIVIALITVAAVVASLTPLTLALEGAAAAPDGPARSIEELP
jgi:hypothetical protein